MRFLLCMAVVLMAAASAAGQSADPLTGGARINYSIIKDYVTRAAAKMPEEHYGFAPASDARSFAAIIGHIADANYRLCSIVAGQSPPMETEVEKTMTRRFELRRVLDLSFAFCDKQYTAMTDSAGATLVTFEAGDEGQRAPVRLPKLGVLAFQTQHAFEHYGNLVTYLWMKGIVPPSSEPRRP